MQLDLNSKMHLIVGYSDPDFEGLLGDLIERSLPLDDTTQMLLSDGSTF